MRTLPARLIEARRRRQSRAWVPATMKMIQIRESHRPSPV